MVRCMVDRTCELMGKGKDALEKERMHLYVVRSLVVALFPCLCITLLRFS